MSVKCVFQGLEAPNLPLKSRMHQEQARQFETFSRGTLFNFCLVRGGVWAGRLCDNEIQALLTEQFVGSIT
eukprot:748793-Amphidinium_carterae.1